MQWQRTILDQYRVVMYPAMWGAPAGVYVERDGTILSTETFDGGGFIYAANVDAKNHARHLADLYRVAVETER